uniref:CDP-diacylglycerol--inositol 3-phosphatidyltransferase n=1 Tax=Tabanus bromius TaxID=304241 RepID=A0A0K8TLC0_TABBR
MSSKKAENIFLFVPNLIGYGRIVLAVISFWYMPTNYVISGWCYIISVFLDSIDGHAARAFNQSTKFGAMLDQLTDRCGTMGLLVTLSYFYPKYMFLFQLSMCIDVACHWLYMQTSVMVGKTSHKAFDVNENVIMRIYYQKNVLTFMCMTNEIFYACLYLLYFTPGPRVLGTSLFRVSAIFCAPFALIKSLISVIHAYVACQDLSAIDIQDRLEVRRRDQSKRVE